MSAIADIEARRAARKAAAAEAQAEQYCKDLEALDALEAEHGDGRVASLKMPAFLPGVPTLCVVSTPTESAFRRFRDMARRNQGKDPGAALDLLASTCVAYPDKETYAKLCAAFPGTHDCVGAAAVKLAEARAADEGK